MPQEEIQMAIARAWFGTVGRFYVADPELLRALLPPGGEWECVAREGAITRTVMWKATEVCLVNPGGSLDDRTEGHIAMALRATPALDKALRVIQALAADPANLQLIARVAETAIAYIQMPAPEIVEPDDDGPDDEPAF